MNKENDREHEKQPEESFFLKKIVVMGSTVLHPEIEEIIRPFENREIIFEELLRVRSMITELYVSKGYITSGAFLPDDQDITSGIVRIEVIEGEIERLDITVSGRLHRGYIEERVRLGIGKPFNQKDLQSALEILQLNPLIERVNAELIPGTTAGKNILQVKIQEAPAFQAGIGYDNYRPPSIGSDQVTIFLSHHNLLGFGDRLSGQYWLSQGLNLYDISYEIPINELDGSLTARYWNSNNVVTESFLQQFEIENQSENFSLSLRQPIIRSVQNEFALDFSFDLRRSQSFLLDENFCFSSPCQDGKTNLTILRFAQEWVNRSPIDVMALQSRFSFGVAAFDAVVTDFEPNSEFFIWLGQFQYLRQINTHNLLLIRFSAQLTPDGLPIIEQFSLGGIDTVRGYVQNQLVTDNGVFGSIEFRVSLTDDPAILQLTPFLEMGTGWNNLFPDPDPATLASVGLGLRWEILRGLTARVDYGIPLISVNRQGNSLQENGFYFSIRYQPF